MFTSINTSNSYYSYDTDQQQHPMLPNDVNPNYKQSQTFISSFSPFSPTYVDSNHEGNIQFFQEHSQDLLMAHLLQQHNLPNRFSTGDGRKDKDVVVNVDVNASGGGGSSGTGAAAAPSSFPFDKEIKDPARRRTSKKDRHSKIVTAKGPRDRRMRLSLDIARKFFSLQDMLGFDKASKTVDWLLRMSKAAIGELYKSMSKAKGSCSASDKSVSSPSEGEVISGIDDITNNEDFNQVSMSGSKPSAALVKEKRARPSRKPAFHPQVKEYRAMARARARERTNVKLWNRSRQCQEENHNHLQHMKSSSPFDKGEESGCHSNDLKSSIDMAAEIEPNSQEEPVNDIVDQSFAVNNGANQSSDFGYNHEIAISQGLNSKNFSFPNFGGNWDITYAGASSTYSAMVNKNLSSGNVEQHIPTSFTITASDTSFQPQFADIQFCRPWESYQGL